MRDIGFVRAGMRAKIKLATFPFQEFGTVDGMVDQVSPNGIVNEKLGLVFPAKIKLQKNFIKVRGKDVKFIPGMAAIGEIVTRKRSILSSLIQPITQRFDESFFR